MARTKQEAADTAALAAGLQAAAAALGSLAASGGSLAASGGLKESSSFSQGFLQGFGHFLDRKVLSEFLDGRGQSGAAALAAPTRKRGGTPLASQAKKRKVARPESMPPSKTPIYTAFVHGVWCAPKEKLFPKELICVFFEKIISFGNVLTELF